MQESSPEPHDTPLNEPFRPVPPPVSVEHALPAEFCAPAEFGVAPIEPPAVPQPKTATITGESTRSRGKCISLLLVSVAILAAAGGAWFYTSRTETPACAMDAAAHLLEQGDYASAFPLLKQAADAEIVPAYVPLAECYTEGLGTVKSSETARHWLLKAEQEGDIAATAALADADYEAHHYDIAAERYVKLGDAIAAEQAYRCARCFLFMAAESDAANNRALAFEWFEVAADKGHAQAALELADAYYNGHSLEAAIKWYTVAAELGLAEAQFRLAWCLMESSPPQNETAVKWLSMAAKQAHPVAAYDLAVCYLSGRGVPRDAASAVYWLKQSATTDYPAAVRRLAFCYRDGTGVPQDIATAVRLFSQAANAGDPEACYNYAWCLYHGYGVQKNPAAAVPFFIQAAAAHFAPAQMALQDMYILKFLPNSYSKLLQKSQNYPKM